MKGYANMIENWDSKQKRNGWKRLDIDEYYTVVIYRTVPLYLEVLPQNSVTFVQWALLYIFIQYSILLC